MAKQTSLFGKVSGKLGAVVFATSGGQTISREYNPNVANPNTQSQVNQRARMKLMSQLSATLSNVIAMTKDGLVSKRNKFTKYNFAYAYAVNGVAQVSYENLQLTEGHLALTQISGSIDDGTLRLFLGTEPSATIARVAWCLFRKTEEGNLEYVKSAVIAERENDTTSPGKYFYWNTRVMNGETTAMADYVIYAYGMVDQSAQATARYGNLSVQSATDLAQLVANRTISTTDYQFTETRGASWNRGQATPIYSGTSIDPNKVRIFATATTGGSVSGAGVYDIGQTVTLTATPDAGYEFSKWQFNGGGDYSTRNPVSFTASEMMDLVAVFETEGGL